MGIPLKNILNIGGLRECKVIAGHKALNNIVTYVTVMEVPDIVKWLKGNELLLTSLYPIKDNVEAQIQLIEKLKEAGTAALAIKPNRFVEKIPEEMKKKADKYGITIIEIPEKISYLDILSPVMNAIFNKKIVLQEDLEQATMLLNEISLTRSGFNEFIKTLAFLTKSKIYLESLVPYIKVDDTTEMMPLSEEQLSELLAIQRPLRMIRYLNKNQAESCIVTPIIIDGYLFGTITSWDYNIEFMEVDLAIQEKASRLLSLEFLRQKVKYEIEQQYKSEYLRDLLLNEDIDTRDLEERGRLYGLKETLPYFLIIIRDKNTLNKNNIFSERLTKVEALLKEIDADIIIGCLRKSLIIMVPYKNQKINSKILDRIYLNSKKVIHQEVKLGVGSTYQGLSGLRKSYREAEKAVTIGPAIKKDQTIIYFEQLGVYRLISLIKEKKELNHFYEEAIGDLLKYDQESDLDLVYTIEQYFKCNESLKETADKLYIHVNTLKYRLQKIKSLTGLSLQKSEEKLMLHMGLKVFNYHYSSQ